MARAGLEGVSTRIWRTEEGLGDGEYVMFAIAVFVIVISFFLCAAPLHSTAAQVDYEVLKRGVVKIVAYKPENVQATGAGMVLGIDKHIALITTAYHVIEDAQRIDVVFFDKRYETFNGKLFEKYHEDLDLAMITVDSTQEKRLPPDLPRFILGNGLKLKEGEKIVTISHPLGTDWEVSLYTNTIAKLSDRGDFRKFRFTKSSIERGNSGGPIFTEEGALIGMISQVEALNTIAVKIDAMLAVLTQEWRIPINLIHPYACVTFLEPLER
jgi:S1-C subfamily serine protease